MKVTLVYPDEMPHHSDWTGYFYAGVALLSAVLKQAGHQTMLIHITQPISEIDFLQRIHQAKPDLIGFSATSHMFPAVKKMASWLVDNQIIVPTICGGIHPTIAPEAALMTKGIDMICRGEGEGPLLELCQKMSEGADINAIPNLWTKRNGVIHKNPLRPLLEDLDSLPFADRSIFSYKDLYREREGCGSFIARRGCPYNCTYCCNHLLRKIYGPGSTKIRFRSVNSLIREIKQVLKDYPFIKTLVFDDDILFFNRTWAEEFAEKYPQEIGLPFVCNSRANLVDQSMVALMKKAGCYHVKFGIESGNKYIADQVLNRQLTQEHIRNAFALCKKAKLITESFNMVGIPYETPEAILDTIKLNARIGVDRMQVTIYQPYQGTKLAELCREQKFLPVTELDPTFFSPSVLKLDTISPAQILMFRNYFKILVFYYRVLQKLPDRLAEGAIRVSDGLFSSSLTAAILNLIYIPLNYIFRKLQNVKSKFRMINSGATFFRHSKPSL